LLGWDHRKKEGTNQTAKGVRGEPARIRITFIRVGNRMPPGLGGKSTRENDRDGKRVWRQVANILDPGATNQ